MTHSLTQFQADTSLENGTKFTRFFNTIGNSVYLPTRNNINSVKNYHQLEEELFTRIEILNKASLLSISDLKGNITFANESFCKLSGYTEEELIGQPHSIVRHPDTPSSLFKEMWKTIGSGKVWQGELKNLTKDGSSYWVLATIAPVMGENNKPVKYISMRIDITAQKKIQQELEEAKKKIDQELHESIGYAKYVHTSFLTPEEELKRAFPESMLVYKAQKIISGDFYKIEQRPNQSIIVFGDSTGHGVSASYISVMVLQALNRLLRAGHNHPQAILNNMHKEIHSITHTRKDNPIIESADTFVGCIDHESMELNYVSARIKGMIIRKGKLIKFEKDNCSVGELSTDKFSLTPHTIKLFAGDRIYFYSDGITDQLGGTKYRKFTSKQVDKLLLDNYTKPMEEQKSIICDAIKEWQGNYEQTDDMTLLGIKIDNTII